MLVLAGSVTVQENIGTFSNVLRPCSIISLGGQRRKLNLFQDLSSRRLEVM